MYLSSERSWPMSGLYDNVLNAPRTKLTLYDFTCAGLTYTAI